MNRKISVIGLGYVGLPVAVAFAYHMQVIAFDINVVRINELVDGFDHTLEVSRDALKLENLNFTADSNCLSDADFHIITVPTPVDNTNQPDLQFLISASQLVAEQLKVGDIVVYESTVYPGVTEEECVPILEKFSGLRCDIDFFVGYSPERINPGDKEHTLAKIKKIVAAENGKALEIISDTYSLIVKAGIYKLDSIKVAEAAKVIENSQRDLNIAFVNELAKIFHLMNIDTNRVLEAAATKWNFIKYSPGLVGGHCIGIDPYYLTYKAQELGYHPEILLAGRRINDDMPRYIAEQTVKKMIDNDKLVRGSKVALLGVTFKEDCPDIRNSKVFDLICELEQYSLQITAHDPVADPVEVDRLHKIKLAKPEELESIKFDVVIIAVAHQQYCDGWLPKYDILIDVKSIFPYKKSDFRL